MRKIIYKWLLLLSVAGVVISVMDDQADIGTMIKSGKLKKDETRNAFLKIAEGKGELCGPIPSKGPLEELEENCVMGYDLGLEIGRDWAELTSTSSSPSQVLFDNIKCQMGHFIEPSRTFSLFHKCTKKGIEDGFDYWYRLVRNPAEKKAMLAELRRQKHLDYVAKTILEAIRKGEKTVYVQGKHIEIPTIYQIHPPGNIVEISSQIPLPPVQPPVIAKHHNTPEDIELLSREKLYDTYMSQLEHGDPDLSKEISHDELESCQNNRIFVLYKRMEDNLKKCIKINELENYMLQVLNHGQATLEELEYLNRVLFEVVSRCGIVKYANTISPPLPAISFAEVSIREITPVSFDPLLLL